MWDPFLNKSAVWTYWQGAYRDTGKNEGATMVLQTADRQGWFWYIPLHDDRVSVGVVAPAKSLLKGRGPREQIYTEEVEKCPAVKERLAGATRVTGYFVTKDYSYRANAGGRRWLGDDRRRLCVSRSAVFVRACCWRSVPARWRRTRSWTDWRKATPPGAQLGRWRPDL